MNLRHKGLTVAEVADFLEITARTVYNIEKNYETGGLAKALHDDPRPGSPVRLDARFKSYVVATVCSDPPEGFDRWTLELIKEQLVKKRVIDTVSHESIRMVLKEHYLNPWQQQSWCVARIDEKFIQRMEGILDVCAGAVNEKRPLICLDEKPIQLLDHVRPPSGMSSGKWTTNIIARARAMCFARSNHRRDATSPKSPSGAQPMTLPDSSNSSHKRMKTSIG